MQCKIGRDFGQKSETTGYGAMEKCCDWFGSWYVYMKTIDFIFERKEAKVNT